ncbi:MAG: BatA and WFA domain-containing protein [Ignavibacteria bacterium]
MNFLNPSILIALSAVSIPILIHLLNLRKIRKVEFSTLMFLKEIQKSKMRRIRLKQILLLLLRIFVIVFLVLGFARPVYKGYAGNPDTRAASTVIIFIDDSFSMNARDNNGLYLDHAKEYVKKILDQHKETDETYFIPTSSIALKERKILFNDYSEILDSLNALPYSLRAASMSEILNTADELLSNSKNAVKEVFIISDFQKANFDNDLKTSEDLKYLKDNPVSTYLIDVGEREISNLSLDSFAVVSKILEKDKDIKIKINLNNFSKFNVSNKTLSLYISDELKGEKSADVNSFDKKEIEFVFNPGKNGNVSGYIELASGEFSDDEIIQDNKYYFTLNIPEKFDIFFIEEDPADFKFINLAFKTASEFLTDSILRRSTLFNINYEKTVSEKIFGSNVAFISNKRSFTDTEANILKDFISNGGGVFMFLGSNIEINNYNSTILNKLNSIQIDKMNTDRDINLNLGFDKVDFEHPVLSEIFRNKDLNLTSEKFRIETPQINSYFNLLMNGNARSVITLTNNKPFLIESEFGKGKILISSVPASNDLSDFPLKTIFVPLIIRSVYYLSNNFDFQKEYIVGDQNLIPVKGLKNISGMITPLKINSQLKIELTNSQEEDYVLLPYSKVTSQAGRYVLIDTAEKTYDFSLNADPPESDLLGMSKDELKKYLSDLEMENIIILTVNDNLTLTVDETRSGFGLWKYFLFGALLFLAAELFLSKKLENS